MARRLFMALLATGVVAPLICSGPAAQAATTAARPYDFDGDGRAELVAGAPGLTVGSVREAGGVVVLPASRKGLSLDERLITQSTSGVPDSPESFEYFGSALASADFDRDGYADLAVATPYESVGTVESAGSVTVVYGSAKGLDPSRSVVITQPGGVGDADVFGRSLAAADLTGDGYPDLAVGSPGADGQPVGDETFGTSGRVVILAGGRDGLSTSAARVLRRQGPGGGSEDWDNGYGSSLGVGDLNGDGATDLVVGSDGANGPDESYPGSVTVCPGAAGGPTGCTRIAHSAAYAGPTSFVIGRVTGASRPELVVAVPDPEEDADGSVRILQLAASGAPAITRTRVLTQASPGIPGSDEGNDAFGSALALADLDRDGYADLVIGARGEDQDRGRVTIVHGAAGGWRTSGNPFYDQSTKGVPSKAEIDDDFGGALTLLDHDGDGRLDLDVGADGENGSGSVTTFRGSGTGFTTKGTRAITLKTLGIGDRSDAGLGNPLGG